MRSWLQESLGVGMPPLASAADSLGCSTSAPQAQIATHARNNLSLSMSVLRERRERHGRCHPGRLPLLRDFSTEILGGTRPAAAYRGAPDQALGTTALVPAVTL